jgi:hypothetical protein
MAPDLPSQLKWAPALPCVIWLRTSPTGWGGLRRCHVSYSFGPRLPAEVGFDAAMCPMAPDLATRLRWALALLRVICLWTSPPSWDGLRRCHMSYGSRPRLLAEVGSGAATCPAGPYEPWASSIKKSLPGLPVQLGTHVPNARVRVFSAPHVRFIMRLQDVQADSVVNTCKACRHASTALLQCDASAMDRSPGTATVTSDSTARRHTANRVQRGRW